MLSTEHHHVYKNEERSLKLQSCFIVIGFNTVVDCGYTFLTISSEDICVKHSFTRIHTSRYCI